MSYPKKLLRLRPTKGIVSDTPTPEVGPDYYTNGSNVIFREGFACRIGGYRTAHDTAVATFGVPILHAINCQFSGTNYWLVCGDNEVSSIESTNAVDVTPVGGLTAVTQPWQWSSALLNGIPILSNGADEPHYWSGSGDIAVLTDWTATESAKSIAVFKYHIFAMDISGPGGSFPNLVKWSAAAEPGTIPNSWTPAASNEAGSVELADGGGPVLCAVPLRDSLIFYKRSTMYSAQYVGGNQVFAFTKVQSSSGALNRHSVCDINGQHFVVTDGDIVITDGTNRRSVGQARMKEWLFSQLDQDYYENLFCLFNRAKNEVYVCFPSAGSDGTCDLALVYDIANDSFGIRTLPSIYHAAIGQVDDTTPTDVWDSDSGVWDDDSSTWNSSAIATATDSLVFLNSTIELQDDDTATNVSASIGRYDIHFDEPERVKFVKRLHVRAKPGYGTLLVRVGSRMTPTDTITWSTEVALTEPEQIVNTFTQGRYISVEIRSTGTDVWCVTGIDMEAELRGYH